VSQQEVPAPHVHLMAAVLAVYEMIDQLPLQPIEHSNPADRHFISALEIQHRISELSSQISGDFDGEDLLVIAVLKGAFMFAADLVRRLQQHGVKVEIDFIHARSYVSGIETSSRVEVDMDIAASITDRNVLLLDDIIDSGRTFISLYNHLKEKSPKSLATCVLLDKAIHRQEEFRVDYIGFEIPDLFVVGYGLDYNESHRCLPYISFID